MTPEERQEIDEWMTIIGKSIQRVKREFDNFKCAVDEMKIDYVGKKGLEECKEDNGND